MQKSKTTKTPLFIMVDIESDGPCPGLFSMHQLGAIAVTKELTGGFCRDLAPISDKFEIAALETTGLSRTKQLSYTDPREAMEAFRDWLMELKGEDKYLVFWSDNNGFDWQFVNYYFHLYFGENPFGHSSSNINSYYKSIYGWGKSFKHLRKTPHTHNALDDATGNAEALSTLIKIHDKELAKKLGLIDER